MDTNSRSDQSELAIMNGLKRRTCVAATLLAFMVLAPTIALSQDVRSPDVLLLNRSSLEEARRSYRSNPTQPTPAAKALMEQADRALQAGIVSVVQKAQTPPSGDKHEYMSVGPYWWPDSTKPDGLPYIRRDGEVNPEYLTFGDHERCGAMIGNVTTLALAYAVSQDERYASRAIRQVRAWFVDPDTRMNPNMEYAQAIKGVNTGRGIGIIETYGFRHLIDSFILLRQSEDWTKELNISVNSWLASYVTWLQESKNGKDEAGWKNNHGSAYDVQVSCIALYLGKKELAERILREVGTKRIAVQIEPDGSQPLELERTKSWGYSIMNLDALIELGLLGDRVGVDLWNFSTSDGRSIRKAVEFLLPYAVGKKKWTWPQIVPFVPDRLYFALDVASRKYGDPSFAAAARGVWKESIGASRTVFFLPPR